MDVTTALSGATTPALVVDVVMPEIVSALGAQSGLLCLLSEDGQWLELLKTVGYPEEVLGSWQRFPADAPTLLREAVRTGQPMLCETREELRQHFPHLAALAERAGHQALAAIPLVCDRGILGALGLSFTQPQSFSEEDRRLMSTLATQCAQALERARLREAERGARALLEAKVAEHQQAEAALRLSEARFRSLVQATAQLVWSTNASGEVVEDSPSWRAFTGQSLEEWLGTGWLQALHPEDRERVVSVWREAVATWSLYEVEYRLRRPDGSYTPVLARGTPVFNPDGTVREWIGANTDITVQKAAEEAQRFHIRVGQVLSESLDTETTLKNIARLAVSHLSDFCMIDLLDERGVLRRHEILAADPVTDAVIQKSRPYPSLVEGNTPMARVLQTGEPLFVHITPEWLDRAARNAEHRASLGQVGPTAAAFVALKARGRTLGLLTLGWTRTHSLPTPKDLGLAQAVADRAAVAIDNARLYAEAQAARVLAEDTGAFREQFIGILGHDLRGPLTAVRMSADLLLRRKEVSEPNRQTLQRIVTSTDKMGRMIEDILDFTRGRLGEGIPVATQPANLQEIARHAVDELAAAHPQRSLQFLTQGSGTGEFDPDRMSQVVTNLVSNALTHGQWETPVRITVKEEGEGLALEVWNQSTPIAPELLSTLFEPFRQGGTRKSASGLGLGLYIVSEVVKAHGGTVTVQSSAEAGTTFTVHLPRTRTPRP
jgi:PAS domain S-box-containing protein